MEMYFLCANLKFIYIHTCTLIFLQLNVHTCTYMYNVDFCKPICTVLVIHCHKLVYLQCITLEFTKCTHYGVIYTNVLMYTYISLVINLFSPGPNKKPRHPVATHQTPPPPPPPPNTQTVTEISIAYDVNILVRIRFIILVQGTFAYTYMLETKLMI